tara:strand:- start:1304 stop:1591 length:288 start_codon:yes stop_codon:yes gene_type:complete
LWKESVKISLKLLKQFFEYDLKSFPSIEGVKVPSGGIFYSKNSLVKLKKIPNNSEPNQISRISRALYFPPHEPAYFLIDNKKYFILPYEFNYINN